MNRFERIGIRSVGKYLAGLAVIFSSTVYIAESRGEEPGARTTVATASANPEFEDAFKNLCRDIYFDSDGSVCTLLGTPNRPTANDPDVDKFQKGMQELSKDLRFDE